MVPEPLLAVFDFQEVELLFHGLPNIDMDDWMRNTDYTGEFNGQTTHKVRVHVCREHRRELTTDFLNLTFYGYLIIWLLHHRTAYPSASPPSLHLSFHVS